MEPGPPPRVAADRVAVADQLGPRCDGHPEHVDEAPQAGDLRLDWSGGGDLNSRPLRPELDEVDDGEDPDGE